MIINAFNDTSPLTSTQYNTIYKRSQVLILSSTKNKKPSTMTTHNTIPVSRIPKSTRLTPYIMSLKRAKEYSISDVRRCLNAQPGQITPTECRRICKHARLRELTKNPLRTLQSYKKEMQICLRYGNREAHYVEGMKQYFALRHTRIGMRHFKISARKHFDQGNYLLGLLKLVSGDHNEGMKILDIFAWKKKRAPLTGSGCN